MTVDCIYTLTWIALERICSHRLTSPFHVLNSSPALITGSYVSTPCKHSTYQMFMDLLVVLTADEKMTVIEGGEVSNPCTGADRG